MKFPTQIEFQGFEPTQQQRALVEQNMAELEKYYERITAGRVVMKGPGHHHRTGGQYKVNIHLALPDGHGEVRPVARSACAGTANRMGRAI